jgi:hypothetical protein
MVNEELLTSEATAALLGITTNHLRQIQWRGALKWKSKQGNRVYYALADIKEYSEGRKPRKTESNAG